MFVLRLPLLLAHSPYGRAAYANVNGLEPAGAGQGYHHQDDQEEQQYLHQQHQQDFGMSPPPAGHSPTRRMAPPPPSRTSTEGIYQPRPPPPVPAEAMASLTIGLDKSGLLPCPVLVSLRLLLVIAASCVLYTLHGTQITWRGFGLFLITRVPIPFPQV